MQIVLKFAMAAIALAIGPMRRIIAAWLFALLTIAFVLTASTWPGNAESYPADRSKSSCPSLRAVRPMLQPDWSRNPSLPDLARAP